MADFTTTAGPKGTISGDPGTSWTNETGRMLYQLRVSFSNSCGACIQWAGRIGPYWNVPFHRGCNCRNVPVPPGKTSHPFVDFAEEVRKLDHAQQTRVVGRANLGLIENGIVGWDDVVTRSRVRTLQEVVSIRRLTPAALQSGGVPSGVARRAWEAVNRPGAAPSPAVVARVVKASGRAGLDAETIRAVVATKVAARLVSSGPVGIPVSQPGGDAAPGGRPRVRPVGPSRAPTTPARGKVLEAIARHLGLDWARLLRLLGGTR